MRFLLLTIVCMVAFRSLCVAQFPAFANFEGRKFYVDSSKGTQPFRDALKLGDSIESYSASSYYKMAIDSFSSVNNRIKVIRQSIVSTVCIGKPKEALLDCLCNNDQYDPEIISLCAERKALKASIDSTRAIKGFTEKDLVAVNAIKEFEKQKNEAEDKLAKKVIDPKKELGSLNTKLTILLDSLVFWREVRNYYASINRFTGSPKFRNAFVPVRSSGHSRFFYQGDENSKIDFLSNFVLQSNLEKTALSSDLISGAVSVINLTLSTTVNDNSDTTNKEKVGNKVLYGALLNGKLSYPVFYRANRHFAIYIPFELKGSVDNVSVNKDTTAGKTFYFGEVAASVYIRIPVQYTNNNNNVSLFFNAKAAYIDGNSQFYDKLEDFRQGFWLSQATTGIEVSNKFRLAINIPLYASEKSLLGSQKATIGIQIDPKVLSLK